MRGGGDSGFQLQTAAKLKSIRGFTWLSSLKHQQLQTSDFFTPQVPSCEMGMQAVLQACPKNDTILILQSLFYSVSGSTCSLHAQKPLKNACFSLKPFVRAIELAFFSETARDLKCLWLCLVFLMNPALKELSFWWVTLLISQHRSQFLNSFFI